MEPLNQTSQNSSSQDNNQTNNDSSLPTIAGNDTVTSQQPVSNGSELQSRLPSVDTAQNGPSHVSQSVPQTGNPLGTGSTDQSVTQKHSQHSPVVADDVDLIEKEWIVKAKAIIEKTSDNPALQNVEINKFKADYLKTRYSKDLKVNEK